MNEEKKTPLQLMIQRLQRTGEDFTVDVLLGNLTNRQLEAIHDAACSDLTSSLQAAEAKLREVETEKRKLEEAASNLVREIRAYQEPECDDGPCSNELHDLESLLPEEAPSAPPDKNKSLSSTPVAEEAEVRRAWLAWFDPETHNCFPDQMLNPDLEANGVVRVKITELSPPPVTAAEGGER